LYIATKKLIGLLWLVTKSLWRKL